MHHVADGCYQSQSPRSNGARVAESGNMSQHSNAAGGVQQRSEHVEQEIKEGTRQQRPRRRQEGGQQNVEGDEPVSERDEQEEDARAVTGVAVAQAEHDDTQNQLNQCQNASNACQERCIHRQGNHWRRTGRRNRGLANGCGAGRHRTDLVGALEMRRKLGERKLWPGRKGSPQKWDARHCASAEREA